MDFYDLDLNDDVLDALDAMNFTTCTPIQEHTIPPPSRRARPDRRGTNGYWQNRSLPAAHPEHAQRWWFP